MSKIILGTAQFGMDYGVNNRRGRIPEKDVFAILDRASKDGIGTIDTAYLYGCSEEIIGAFIKSGKNTFKVVSKLPKCASEGVSKIFEETLKRLGMPSLYGYLIHSFESYEKDKRLWDELKKLKAEGRVEKIGFSLYLPAELERLFKEGIDIDILQLPFSVFDQRFDPYLAEIKNNGIELQVRSIFLQGLVFKDLECLDTYFVKIKDKLEVLNALSVKLGVSIVSLCVNFTVANKFIDKVVVGVDSLLDLVEIISASKAGFLSKDVMHEIKNMRIDDEDILLPFMWKLSN